MAMQLLTLCHMTLLSDKYTVKIRVSRKIHAVKFEIKSQITRQVSVQSCSQAVPFAWRFASDNFSFSDFFKGSLLPGGPLLSGLPLLSGRPQ